ncbi:MAG TPA: hypothetical protein VG097_10545 [Gemmata sp.]|jgi:hypothetical protein|nr:hypothetical protein [Gemmata sp.]
MFNRLLNRLRPWGTTISVLGGLVLFFSWFAEKTLSGSYADEKSRFDQLKSDYTALDRYLSTANDIWDTQTKVELLKPASSFTDVQYSEIITVRSRAFKYLDRMSVVQDVQPLAQALKNSWSGPKSSVADSALAAWAKLSTEGRIRETLILKLKDAGKAVDNALKTKAPADLKQALDTVTDLKNYCDTVVDKLVKIDGNGDQQALDVDIVADDVLNEADAKINRLAVRRDFFLHMSYWLNGIGTILILLGQLVDRFRRPGLSEAVGAAVSAVVTPIVSHHLPTLTAERVAAVIQTSVTDAVQGSLTAPVRHAGQAAVIAAAIVSVTPAIVTSALDRALGGDTALPAAANDAVTTAFERTIPLALAAALSANLE